MLHLKRIIIVSLNKIAHVPFHYQTTKFGHISKEPPHRSSLHVIPMLLPLTHQVQTQIITYINNSKTP